MERYERQIILKGFGTVAQQKLSNAKVLVIGAGGLGCPALQYLAAVGIGTLGIIDHDIISLNNLHRQILYHTGDVGKYKCELAKLSLAALNPEINIISYNVQLVRQNILNLISLYDYILDCTDNFDSRYLINDACLLLKKPLIYAAVSGYEGQLAIFNIPDSSGISTNYRDLFPIPPSLGEIPNCAENGVLGVLPGILGTMQSAEAIKLITGIGIPLINKLLNYDLLKQEFYQVSITKSESDAYVQPTLEDFQTQDHKDMLEIDALQLTTLINNFDLLILDVRELYEIPKLKGLNYMQIPMSSLNELTFETIPNREVVIICQHGLRSLHAAEFLNDIKGIDKKFYSLKGGVVKWKTELSHLGLLN